MEHPVGKGQHQPTGSARTGCGIGGVLRELDHHPVAVAAADQVVLGVGVFTEPGRRRRPRVEHPAAQRRGAERVVVRPSHAPDGTFVPVTGLATSPGGRLRAVAATALAVILLGSLLVTVAGPAAAAVCDTETIDRSATGLVSYDVTVCLVTPGDGDQLADPVDVTATATVTDPSGRAHVRRVTFRWKPTGAGTDTYLLTDNDAEQPGDLYRMSLRSNRLPGATGTLTARAVVDDDELDGAETTTTVDTTVDLTKDAATTPPVAPPFSPRLGAPPPGERYTMAATGDGVDGSPQSHAVVNVIKGWNPDSFGYLGDVYTSGTAYEFDTWYGEAGGYGDLSSITNPVIGNHEYRPGLGATPYFEYWGGVPHYYSYDVGGWHVVVLDTNTEFAETAVGSPQYRWVDADLAAHQNQCTIVLQHQPRYAEVPGSRAYLQDLWSLAYQRGVTLLLTGHVHKYERWTAMDAAGAPVAGGLTQIVAGGGGREAVTESTPDPRVAARGGVGALRLDLGAVDLAFTYVEASGVTVDQGSVPCRQRIPAPPPAPTPPPADTTAPTTPTGLAARATSTTSARLSWQPASDAVGVTAYVVRRNDAVVAALPGSATSWDDPGLSQGRTYRWTVEAEDVAGNRSAQSAPATATTPMPLRSTRALLAGLRTAPEHRAGWTSRRFPGWTTDVDGCLTPSRVFLDQAVVAPRVRAGCDLRGGTWRSRYDGAVRRSVSRLTADHLVGLREAWESGAYRWSLRTRGQHANDLGYPSTLIAVTKASATAKGGREPQDWLPRKAFRCSYLGQWVAVKWRWRLAVDPAERRFLKTRLSSCGWPSVRLPSRPRT